MLIALAGCRTDVEGDWDGWIGDGHATLDLKQKGEVVEGRVCWHDVCDDIQRGSMIDETLTLQFGCPGCYLPDTELLLTVLPAGKLEGDASVQGAVVDQGCPCEEAEQPCSCQLQAEFSE